MPDLTTVLATCYYLTLSTLGHHLLWHRLQQNGAGKAMMEVVRSGRLPPNNRSLQRSFTGISAIDKRLQPAAVFYYRLLDGRDKVHRALLVDLHATMQAVAFCMLVEGREWGGGWGIVSFLIPSVWGTLNQFYGAAFIYPLYLLLHLRPGTTHPQQHSRIMPPAEAYALCIRAFIGAFGPAFLLLPAFVRCSDVRRQRLIALYRLAPIVYVIFHAVVTRLVDMWGHTSLNDGEKEESLVVLASAIAGLGAALPHMFSLTTIARDGYPMRRFLKTYSPWSTRVDTAARTVIADGAFLFLQWDMVVIVAAFVAYACWLVVPGLQARGLMPGFFGSYPGMAQVCVGSAVSFVCFLVGPGAVLALALAFAFAVGEGLR